MKRIRMFALILIIATSINQTFSQSADNKFDAEKIFNFKNPKELTDFYGTENVKTENAYDYEGNIIGMAVVIYPKTKNELKIIFDSYESKIYDDNIEQI